MKKENMGGHSPPGPYKSFVHASQYVYSYKNLLAIFCLCLVFFSSSFVLIFGFLEEMALMEKLHISQSIGRCNLPLKVKVHIRLIHFFGDSNPAKQGFFLVKFNSKFNENTIKHIYFWTSFLFKLKTLL